MKQQNKDLILLILDMQGIEGRLREFERKYRLRSNMFYQLVKEGKIEQRLELLEWVGLSDIKSSYAAQSGWVRRERCGRCDCECLSYDR